jgi:tetratricopeptide (TPR) repeat protein
VDALGADTAVRDQILHQERQLAVVLDATLAMLPEPCLTALAYAARLPADIVPWPWLRALVAQRHPEIGTHDPAEPDPWLTVRRQLDGLRLLTPGDDPEVARMHRLVAAHLGARAGDGAEADEALTAFLTERASAIYDQTNAPAAWELPAIVAALPSLLPPGTTRRGLAYRAVFLARKVAAYHNLPLAEALLAATHPVFASLVVSEPTNTVWQRDLSVSHERVGDVLRDQGDLDGALRDYRESLAIRERLAAGDPANAVWQRDLSVSHNKVGDVLLAQGDLDGALRDYRESLAIRERLAASDPANAGWQRDLSVSHEKVGAVLHDQGDLNGALRDYRESLAIAERLAASDPANAGWQRDLSSSHCYVGMVLQEQGDLDGALEAYRKYQAGMQRLAASDPSNAGWQRDLSVSHEKVGDVLRSQGDLVGAMRDYRESLAIAERLAASDPANAGWQRDLSVSHERVGDVLRDQADLDGALQAYREDLAIAERLAAGDPSNAGWQRDLWVSYYRLASVAEAAEEPEAKEWWQKAYTVLAGMVERGLFVSSQDMRALASLRGKAGLDSDNG